MRWLYVLATLIFLAGCGDINWFPDATSSGSPGGSSGNATGPAPFAFPTKTISAVTAALGAQSESDVVTISGDNPNGWNMTLSDSPASTKSEAMVNSTFYPRSASGVLGTITVKPGDTVQIFQTPLTTAGTVSTIVTIGTTTAEFKTVTQ